MIRYDSGPAKVRWSETRDGCLSDNRTSPVTVNSLGFANIRIVRVVH